MNQFDFKEFRILRCPHRGKYGNLTMTIEFQETDAPLELELYYRKCWQDGVTLKGEITEIEKEVKNSEGLSSIFEVSDPPKTISIYQEFKWFCEKMGKDYEQEKQIMRNLFYPKNDPILFKHMKQLEDCMPLQTIEDILKNRMSEINEEMGFYDEQN